MTTQTPDADEAKRAARAKLIDEMFEVADRILLSAKEWAKLTVDAHEKEPDRIQSVNARTIYRMQNGHIPRDSTLYALKLVLIMEAFTRGYQPNKSSIADAISTVAGGSGGGPSA